MPPSRTSSKMPTEGETKRLVALKFDKIGGMAHFYLHTDMGDIAEKTITTDLRYLEKIHLEFPKLLKTLKTNEAQLLFRELSQKIESQVDEIIPYLYSSRDARKQQGGNFYHEMQKSRKHWRIILDLLRHRLGADL